LGSTRRMKCGIFCTEEQHDFVAGAAYVAGADGHYGVAGRASRSRNSMLSCMERK